MAEVRATAAERFLDKRRADPKLAVDEKWDDAVKALLNYPEIVKTMSGDLDWTTALGEAVVKDQGEVLEAVQVFRRKVQAAGNLKTDAKQVVVVEKEVIKIVPADPQVIYVPQYNPTTVVVYGSYSSWGYWPSPYPVYYYPYAPGAAFAAGVIWGAAIGAAWHGDHTSRTTAVTAATTTSTSMSATSTSIARGPGSGPAATRPGSRTSARARSAVPPAGRRRRASATTVQAVPVRGARRQHRALVRPGPPRHGPRRSPQPPIEPAAPAPGR